MDTELNFNENRKLQVGKANRMMGAIRRSFTYLDKHTFVKLYKSMVRCHLEYAVPVWFPYLRMLACTKNLEYEDRLKFLDLPTLVYRRHRGDMIQTYKIINGYYEYESCPKFEMRGERVASNRLNRGHSKQVFIQRSRKEIRANSFTRRVAPIWNGLTEEIVSAESVDKFKELLDKMWENQPMKWDYTQRVVL